MHAVGMLLGSSMFAGLVGSIGLTGSREDRRAWLALVFVGWLGYAVVLAIGVWGAR